MSAGKRYKKLNQNTNIDSITENKATGLARLALAFFTSDHDPDKAPLAKNIVEYTDRADTLDRITKKVNSTIYRCAERGLIGANVSLWEDKSLMSIPRDDLDPYLKDTDIVIIYREADAPWHDGHRPRYLYADLKLYGRISTWRLFSENNLGNEGIEEVSRAIVEAIEKEYTKPERKLAFGNPSYFIPAWIPHNFSAQNHDIESIVEALKLGVPYEDIFADYNV